MASRASAGSLCARLDVSVLRLLVEGDEVLRRHVRAGVSNYVAWVIVGEENDLSGERPEIVGELTAKIQAKLAEEGRTPQEVEDISNEAVERMRALGYME